MTEQEREGLDRNTGPHDDVIPGPTDDTYQGSAPADREAEEEQAGAGAAGASGGTHPGTGRGKPGADELADDPGERRFDYS